MMNKCNKDILLCKSHKQDTIMLDLGKNVQLEDRTLCGLCLINFTGKSELMAIKQAQEIIQDKKNSLKVEFGQWIQMLVKEIKGKIQIVKDIQFSLDTSIAQIKKMLITWTDHLSNIATNFENYNLIDNIDLLLKSKKNTLFEEIQNDIQLINLENYEDAENKLESFKNKLPNLQKDLMKSIETLKSSLTLKTKTYNDLEYKPKDQSIESLSLIQINTIPQKEYSRSVAFNFDDSIIALACDKSIKLLEFELKNPKPQFLNQHDNAITCLRFSKHHNWLFSADFLSGQIMVWQQKSQNEWIVSKAVQKHQDSVTCIVLDSQETELISSSADHSIIVWKVSFEFNTIAYKYSLNKHTSDVNSISINNCGDFLISCSEDKSIKVWNKVNGIWEFIQTIEINQTAFRLCFIENSQFVFQENNSNFIRIFQQQSNEQQFTEKNNFKCQLNNSSGKDTVGFFHSTFNYEFKFIFHKWMDQIYLILQAKQGKFFISEKKKFHTDRIYGSVSNNGRKAVIWDSDSKEFKIFEILIEY